MLGICPQGSQGPEGETGPHCECRGKSSMYTETGEQGAAGCQAEGSPELRRGRGEHPGGAVTAAMRDPRA